MTAGLVVGRERRLISGWGRTSILSAQVAAPESIEAVVSLVNESASIVPRGLGRSYGDAAQLTGGVALDMNRLDRITSFDPTTGIVDVEAGVSLDHLMRVFVPQGWFVPVTPGTRFVTIGGAIGSDIHGKNHHHDGTFGQHLVDLTLVGGDGEVHTVSPSSDPDLFWATVGGMGLTGVITSARLKMMPIDSAKISSVAVRVPNLDVLIEKMFEVDRAAQYSVAWVDCLAGGSSFGRGVLMYGDHATAEQVGRRADRWDFGAPQPMEFPFDLPSGTLNRYTVKAFNEVWYRKAPKVAKPRIETIPAFFHPLDAVGEWNRVYGSGGFIQYQFVVPDDSSDVVRSAIAQLREIGAASFLAVLKRFGPANQAPLSFPATGWTLALDIPARLAGLGPTLDRLDAEVAEVGGKIYLTKDSRLRPELLATMYPRLQQWQEVRARVDPQRRFNSDMAIRLGM